MARKPRLYKNDKALLADIVNKTKELGMTFVPESKEAKKLIELELIEVDLQNLDKLGNAACRATEIGIEKIVGKVVEDAVDAVKSFFGFEIEKNVPIPPSTRGGRRGTKYPWDQMEIGDSFHVPVTEKMHNPAKSLASGCSSAIHRYKTEDGKVTRRFVARPVGKDDTKGIGARVFRIS